MIRLSEPKDKGGDEGRGEIKILGGKRGKGKTGKGEKITKSRRQAATI
jgi:hypothetical protein